MADYTTVDPWIISADTHAEIAFLSAVLNATSRGEPVLNSDGRVGHAELAIGDSVVMLFDADSTHPAFLRVFVDDAAGVLAKAESAGARVVTKQVEMFWGDITARFRDPQGHLWWVSQRQQLSEAEVERRASDPKFAESMEYAQASGAAELASLQGRNTRTGIGEDRTE